jgi:hypothetical protein
MALQRTALAAAPIPLQGSAAAIVTNPASTKTYVRGISFFSTASSGTETVKVYVVAPTAGAVGTAATENQIFEADIPPKGSVTWEIPYVITLTQTNHTIQASCTTGGAVNCYPHGDKE